MRKLLFALILQSTLFASHWNEGQVAQYVHHSELQRRSTWNLLSQISFRGDEAILDVGCGDGRNTAWMAVMVRQGEVVGIDPSPAMLNWGSRQYHPADFPNLTLQSGDALQLPEREFDVITSFFSLHIVKEKKKALEGFYAHLKPGGRLICVLPPPPNLTPEYFEALNETMSSRTWSSYFEGFQTTFRFETLEDYRQYCEEAGFTNVKTEYIATVDPFVNKEEFIHWFTGTMPHIHRLPKSLQETFILDLLTCYLKKKPEAQLDDGAICFFWGHFELCGEK